MAFYSLEINAIILKHMAYSSCWSYKPEVDSHV